MLDVRVRSGAKPCPAEARAALKSPAQRPACHTQRRPRLFHQPPRCTSQTPIQTLPDDAAAGPAPARQERATADSPPLGVDQSGRLPGQKRSVAMHVAYVGTYFRGLQLSRDFPVESTVEGVLERALLEAGFIAPSNYGDLFKIKWTRSSRTDKGVHSLATVIGARVVIEDADNLFVTDPEGQSVTTAINDKLPNTVRVLSVQRVNKKFNARRFCKARSYEYLLPADIIDLKCDGSEEDKEKLSLFRSLLALYVGKHPFHNFTVRRKAYLETPATREDNKQASGASDSDVPDDGGTDGESGYTETDDITDLLSPETASETGEPSTSTPDSSSGETQEPRRWTQLCGWQSEVTETDRVGVRHYRVITEFTADDPRHLVPGGRPCLLLRVSGHSFMLNQIRHMIGGAIAVTCGHMSKELLGAALSAPARVSVPKAPPHTLCLSGVDFPPFRLCGGVAKVAQYSGDSLELRPLGLAAQTDFREHVLAPELDRLTQHPDWDRLKASLNRFYWDPEAEEHVLASYGTWLLERQAAKNTQAYDKLMMQEPDTDVHAV